MTLPEPFTTAARANATYDYEDVVNGTGVVTFYGIWEKPSTGTDWFLSSTNDYPSGSEILNNADIDLDLTEFTTPRTATGTATIKATTQLAASTFTAQLRKWDGTTETNITSAIQTASLGAGEEAIIRLPITETHFAAGDVLRLNLNGRLEVEDTKPISISVPFRIDI